ncbi:hypothetical protein IQ255_01945 [Pleurocapsales cyanobacterium LEGE 10410]|nr:hypothetical protein [Pleurocapsales cyanobacterium LEGE 10410]
MKISNLNYLEVVSTETGNALAGGGDIAFNIAKDVNLNKVVTLDIDKVVDVNVNNPDQLATAEADAEAFGIYALAETDAYTYVTEQEAFSYSESTAALDLNPGVDNGVTPA